MSSEYKPPFFDWYLKHEVRPPETIPHGTEDNIRELLKPLKTWNWRLVGNHLECDTDQGKLSQAIDPGYICLGDGPDGMPLLKKIEV